MAGTIEINGTGGIIEGNLGAANVNVNLDPVYGNFVPSTTALSTDSDFDDIWSVTSNIGGVVSAWIYPTATGRIVSKSWHIQIREESSGTSKLRFQSQHTGTAGVWTTSGTFARPVIFNAWNHITVFYDADDVSNNPTFYINGQKYTVGGTYAINEDVTPATYGSDAATDFKIGNDGSSNSFTGYMTYLKVYKNV